MSTRQYLAPVQVTYAKRLKEAGFTRYRIGVTFAIVYGFSKKTIYRHLNEDPTKYVNPPNRQSRQRPPEFQEIQRLKRENADITSGEVASLLGLPLQLVNKHWV